MEFPNFLGLVFAKPFLELFPILELDFIYFLPKVQSPHCWVSLLYCLQWLLPHLNQYFCVQEILTYAWYLQIASLLGLYWSLSATDSSALILWCMPSFAYTLQCQLPLFYKSLWTGTTLILTNLASAFSSLYQTQNKVCNHHLISKLLTAHIFFPVF